YEIARELVRLSPETEDEGIEKIEKLIRSHPQSQFFQRLNQSFNQLREKNRPIYYPHLPASGNMEIDN
ncbi:MAG: hypothetical protein KDA84_09970, partial [Planctomycetaceae bacterium]|nr:hypothetical protein [Planctomycetaceae bacterium]